MMIHLEPPLTPSSGCFCMAVLQRFHVISFKSSDGQFSIRACEVHHGRTSCILFSITKLLPSVNSVECLGPILVHMHAKTKKSVLGQHLRLQFTLSYRIALNSHYQAYEALHRDCDCPLHLFHYPMGNNLNSASVANNARASIVFKVRPPGFEPGTTGLRIQGSNQTELRAHNMVGR